MLMAMLDNCSECREVLKQNFQNYFIVGILLTCFPVLWHRSEYCSIYSSESFKTPLINIEWLERGQGNSSHSGGESNSTILCSDCNTYRAWLSIFSIDFHHHLFYQLLDAPACLTGSWKHYRAKLPAESDGSFSQGNSGISALRMENPQGSFQKYYLCIHVHFGVYLEARCPTTSRTHICSWLCSEASPKAEGSSSNISSGSTGCVSVRSVPFVKSVAGVKIQIGE